MRHDDKRDRILAAATAVFAERDFHRVQVSEVAERAGVGKGTLYLYFPTKDALHRVALRKSLEHVAEQVDHAAAADLPAAEALRAIVLAILRFFWRRQHLLTVVQRYETRGRPGDGRHRVIAAIDAVLARHRLGPTTGGQRRLYAAFLTGLARAAILNHRPTDRPEATADRIVALYLNGLGARVRPAARGARRQRGAA